MLLTPREVDRLLLFQAAELARARRARGLRLNAPEAIAIIGDAACEAARDGATHAQAVDAARAALGPDDVLDGVAALVGHVEVEALFPDGTRLLVIEAPLGPAPAGGPGAIESASAPPDDSGDVVEVGVANRASVPIAVTSHWHFFEANRQLDFDRATAWGRRLAIPTGSTVRWAPGETRTVVLRPFAGARIAYGFNGLVNGPLDAPGAREAALALAAERGFRGAAQ
ncbi:MAG: urease subunit gamma [Gaiellales bacterium]